MEWEIHVYKETKQHKTIQVLESTLSTFVSAKKMMFVIFSRPKTPLVKGAFYLVSVCNRFRLIRNRCT